MTNKATIPQGNFSYVVEAWWDGASMTVATMPSLPNGRNSKVIQMWRNASRHPERRGYSQSHWRKISRESRRTHLNEVSR